LRLLAPPDSHPLSLHDALPICFERAIVVAEKSDPGSDPLQGLGALLQIFGSRGSKLRPDEVLGCGIAEGMTAVLEPGFVLLAEHLELSYDLFTGPRGKEAQ